MLLNVMFATPSLEERFRRTVDSDTEVGGLLFCAYRHPFLSRRPFSKVIERSGFLLFIHSWLVVPNTATDPKRNWSAWDLDKMKVLGRETGESLGTPYVIHFHSHPINTLNRPSDTDIAFWAKHFTWSSYNAVGAIAYSMPLRVHVYDVEIKLAGIAPVDGEKPIRQGEYYSWREKRFSPIREYLP